MRRNFQFLLLFFLVASLMTSNGCGSENPKQRRSSQRLNFDNWLMSGQVANAGYSGGEVLALGLDGMRYRTRIDENQSFAIQLPGNASYALYFLEAPAKDYTGEGALNGVAIPAHAVGKEAVLNFEESPDVGIRNTLRLPKVLFQNRINLGQIDIKAGQAFPTINPALSFDFDNDGINDFADRDDQNDGLSDLEQQQATERMEICHFNERDEGKTVRVALADLYNHVEDGDTLGPCVAAQGIAPVDASIQDIEVAPKNPAPPPAPKEQPPAAQPPAVLPLTPLKPAPHNDEANEAKNHEGDEGKDEDEDKEGDEDNDDSDSDEKDDLEEDEDKDEDADDDADKVDDHRKDDKHKRRPPRKPRPRLRFS